MEFNLKQQRDEGIKQVEAVLEKERSQRIAADRGLDAARLAIVG